MYKTRSADYCNIPLAVYFFNIFSIVSRFRFLVLLQPILAVWSCVWTPKALQPDAISATSCTTLTSCGITRLFPSSSLMGAACLARRPQILRGRGMASWRLELWWYLVKNSEFHCPFLCVAFSFASSAYLLWWLYNLRWFGIISFVSMIASMRHFSLSVHTEPWVLVVLLELGCPHYLKG